MWQRKFSKTARYSNHSTGFHFQAENLTVKNALGKLFKIPKCNLSFINQLSIYCPIRPTITWWATGSTFQCGAHKIGAVQPQLHDPHCNMDRVNLSCNCPGNGMLYMSTALHWTKYLCINKEVYEGSVFPRGNLGKEAQTERVIGDNLTCFPLVTNALPEREHGIYPHCEDAVYIRVFTSTEMIWFEPWGSVCM